MLSKRLALKILDYYFNGRESRREASPLFDKILNTNF